MEISSTRFLHIQMNPRKSEVNDGDHKQHADGNSVADISPELNEFCKAH